MDIKLASLDRGKQSKNLSLGHIFCNGAQATQYSGVSDWSVFNVIWTTMEIYSTDNS